jgi:hypothetical protein
MRRMALPFLLLALVLVTVPNLATAADTGNNTTNASDAKKAEPQKPADRVVVIYFHRTQRCPTCLRMGSYSEEAVAEGFPNEIKDGTVEFHYVDFQSPRNAALTKAYKVTGPSLVAVKILNDRAVAAENLKEIWTKNGDKDAFLKYVRDHVEAYQKSLVKPANRVLVIYFHRTQRCPTCLRMGSYSEEAVMKGFPQQIEERTVEFRYVDFQDERNASLTKAYNITGPSLVALQIVKNRPAQTENLKEIWAKNGDKDAFLKYVRDHVAAYQESLPKTAMKPVSGSSQKAK